MQQDLLNFDNVMCQVENQIESQKKPRWSYSPGPFLPEKQNPPKTVSRDTKSLSSSEISRITFDSQLTFQKHVEDTLDCCNTRCHRLKLLVNQKWGPSPSTIIQIYTQCVQPIFEYSSLSTITTSDNVISEIQQVQNKFIRLALRLPKYICHKLFHDSAGLPYVKDRLLSCVTKSPDGIVQNPLVKGVNIF